MRLWDARNGWSLGTIGSFDNEAGSVGSIAISRARHVVASAGGSGLIGVWAMETGKRAWRRKAHLYYVREVAFSQDGRWVISCGNDDHFNIKVWDAVTGYTIKGFTSEKIALSSSLCSDGRRLRVFVDYSEIRVIDIDTEETVGRYEPEPGRGMDCAAWLRGDRYVLLAGRRGDEEGLLLVDLREKREVQRFPVEEVRCVAVSPNGRLAATRGWDHSVRLWQLPEFTGKALPSGGR